MTRMGANTLALLRTEQEETEAAEHEGVQVPGYSRQFALFAGDHLLGLDRNVAQDASTRFCQQRFRPL